ncbi:MAG: hypothetical protein EA376_01775 [Phycisphaeraceae bacterium]|nr:MAG: hypothetical protein EA376_01775 [Phycisphaeraceae bacterium]
MTRERDVKTMCSAMDARPPGVELPISYNVAPTQPSLIVRPIAAGGREGAIARWGLIPSWAKDPSIGSRMINARAETAAAKPAFRAAMRRRRCIVPADSFYEWQAVEGSKRKRPWRIHRADGERRCRAGAAPPRRRRHADRPPGRHARKQPRQRRPVPHRARRGSVTPTDASPYGRAGRHVPRPSRRIPPWPATGRPGATRANSGRVGGRGAGSGPDRTGQESLSISAAVPAGVG